MNTKIMPVILSGGSGSRLWPMSRSGFPKQFLSLDGANTMLQQTALRATGDSFLPPLLVCNEDHRFIAAEQLRAVGLEQSQIILEPAARNTAPAIAVAALAAMSVDKDAVILVMPSDHIVKDINAFKQGVDKALLAVDEGFLVTFGIDPDKPETGYGYINGAGEVKNANGVKKVKKFVEKPDETTAMDYLASGDYYWNSGIFLMRASQYIEELEKHHPEMVSCCTRAYQNSQQDLSFCRLDNEAFSQCQSDSIDYAVMERTSFAAVVPLSMGWSDLGAWSALWDVNEKDENGNVCSGDVLLHNSKNSYVHSDHGLVALTGVENLVVAVTDDAVLIADKDSTQDVKKLVESLKEQGRTEHVLHRTVHRPWGSYCGIDTGERYQVKRITVKPGERLSLQMHHHRAEHWIVVSGTALVVNGEKQFLLRENESTYIPIGETHRLENPGKVPLHLIEVQSGSYLGEDDIVRFEDGYGRTENT